MTTSSVRYDEVSVGDEIPVLEIPLTRTLIVATAIASRDYQDVHHDPALAQEKGSPDVFMNILTTNGLVGRYVTDWAGPNALLRSVRIRLGAPNYPGDTMRLTGSVVGKADGMVELAIRGVNSLGDHVTGTVSLALPDAPISWKAPAADPDATQSKKSKKSKKKKKSKESGKKTRKTSNTSTKGGTK
jgi:acyl dehydratase